tara:strand:+ start:28 stop:453 length:426 start_codon:yes stop_codon:yes gene_type:complete
MGKNKYIESPDVLLDLFNQYKEWVKKNPITIEDYVGKDATRVMREKPRCYTVEGFENYLAIKNIIQHLSDYFANTDNNYDEYSTICSRIKREVRQNQIEGGMAGIYNPSITQRLNGLVDKKQTEIKGGLNIPNLPDIGNRK